MFDGPFSDSIIKRALDNEIISIHLEQIRNYSKSRYGAVDDYPYGGAPGMVMRPDILAAALDDAQKRMDGKRYKTIYMSPRGELLTHQVAQELTEEDGLIILCGRYKGIDQRICDSYVDREISMGDFILSGGEIPAMALVDSVTRLLPGSLGNAESAGNDSFYDMLLSPPDYTRPEVFEGKRVPDILLSGHHSNIEKWRHEQREQITKERRPDIWERYLKSRNK